MSSKSEDLFVYKAHKCLWLIAPTSEAGSLIQISPISNNFIGIFEALFDSNHFNKPGISVFLTTE